ncbi:MAG TPA: hypothetical protein VE961_13785 [Pyrinomonadaceae bacterium]|nr:hypothetical protein [Pyrinomonadaceae bacterium]
MKTEGRQIQFTASPSIKRLGDSHYEADAVVFGDEPDCDGEVFDPGMTLERLGLDDERKFLPLFFAHQQDPTIGKKRLAKASYELVPGKSLKIRWAFENPLDPQVRNIVKLCDEDAMAISSGANGGEKRKEQRFTRIITWPIFEVSLTSSACALSGRTRVTPAKDYESLSFAEMMRLCGLSEAQIMREQSNEVRHKALAALGEKCGCGSCGCGSDEWLAAERAKRVRYLASEGQLRDGRDVKLTMQEARQRLHKAESLLAETEQYAAEIKTERARLHLGDGVPFRHLEDWILAGQKSGFINHRWSLR